MGKTGMAAAVALTMAAGAAWAQTPAETEARTLALEARKLELEARRLDLEARRLDMEARRDMRQGRHGEGRHAEGRRDREARGPGRRGGGLEEMFARLDADGDGRITREEAAQAGFLDLDAAPFDLPAFEAALSADMTERAAARAARMFERLDANGDGVLDADEIAAARERRAARMFDRLDRDGDGAVTRDEAARRRGGPRG